MFKHGTKYISESEDPEWFEELNLAQFADPKTGRLLIPPPIGTEVTIKFIEDIPCHRSGDDETYEHNVIIDGEVMKYHDDDPNVLLIMFDGGWQQECGWDCREEILELNDNKCYWIHISEEEVYLKNKQLQESEEDDLEWAQDTVSGNLRLKYSEAFKYLDNDDIISVSGYLMDDDNPPNTLCVLDNSMFKVNRKYKDNVQVSWLTPRNERPANWREVTNVKESESDDNLILYHGSETGFNDDSLDIVFIEKADHPF